MKEPVYLLYIHAPEDDALCRELEDHLAVLWQQGLIKGLHAGRLDPGVEVQRQLEQHLQSADVVLFLLSASLFASDRDYALLEQALVEQALRRHDDRALVLVPVIVRPVSWKISPLGGLQALPRGDMAVTSWRDRDQAWEDVVDGIRSLITPPADPPGAAPVPDNPYRGLEAFHEEHAALFFGREELTRQLWQAFYRLHRKEDALRLLSIIGPSGSGKSSVARAGLVPLLRREGMPGWKGLRVVVVTPGDRPIERLARELHALLPGHMLQAVGVREVEAVLRRPGESGAYEGLRRFVTDDLKTSLLVLVDQFEAVYSPRTTPMDRDLFVGLILHAAADREQGVSVVLTLRSDFFEETRAHPELNRAIAHKEAHVLVPLMSREELRRAIIAPAAQQGRPLDPGTGELLLKESEGRRGALPLLEFALLRIWEGLKHGQEPTHTLEAIGGVGGALAAEAQRIYDKLEEPQKKIARRAFLKMVQLGEGVKDTRRRVRVADLAAQGESQDQVHRVLRQFAEPGARLVTLLIDDQDQEVAEVTHEALFDHWRLLQEWIEAGRKDLRFHDRLREDVQHWDAHGRLGVHLWQPPDLDLLVAFSHRAAADMTAQETEFLKSCRRAEGKRRWSKRGAAAILFLLGVAGLWWRHVEDLRRRDQELQQANQAAQELILLLSRQPGEATRALGEAIRLWGQSRERGQPPGPQIIEALTTALITPAPARPPLLHDGPVWTVAFSPDGQQLATASGEHAVQIWDIPTGRSRLILAGPSKEVMALGFAADGTTLIGAGMDRSVRVWDAGSGAALASMQGHSAGLYAFDLSRDGHFVATAGDDPTVRLWDLHTRKLAAILSGHRGTVVSVAFSPDGGQVATAGDDGTARLWNLAPSEDGPVLRGHRVLQGDKDKAPLTLVAFSSDGQLLLSAGEDGKGRLWDPQSGFLRMELRGHRGPIRAAAFSRSGNLVVTGSDDTTGRLWDGEGNTVAILKGHTGPIGSVSFSPDGAQVATGGGDHSVRLWHGLTGIPLATLHGHTDAIQALAYAPEGGILASASRDHSVRLWQVQPADRPPRLGESRLWAAAGSPDGRVLATAHEDGVVRLWDAGGPALKLARELRGHEGAARALAFSQDGKRLASGGMDHTVRIWEVATGAPLRVLRGHHDAVSSVAFSQDGNRLLSGSWDGTACIWDSGGQVLLPLAISRDAVLSVTFSPGEDAILIASGDGNAYVYDTRTGALQLTLSGHQDSVRQAYYSPDGTRIVTASMDDTARLWDARRGTLQSVLDHRDDVLSAVFSPDGTRIATASNDGTARLWDGGTGTIQGTFPGHAAGVLAVIFSGPRLLTLDADGIALFHPTNFVEILSRACQRIRPWPEAAAVVRFCTPQTR